MQDAWRHDPRRDTLHTIRLFEIRVALVQILVVFLQLAIVNRVALSSLRHDVRLKIEQRSSVRFAGQRCLAD
jgi:hypothetical protein